VLVALLSVPVFLVAALNTISCCAIDPEKFPAKVAANKRHQANAALLALATAIVGTGAVVGIVLLRPRHHPTEHPAPSPRGEWPAR